MTDQKKPGRPPKANNLEERIVNMEKCLSKMAHMTGQQRVLDEFGIDRWELQKKDMSKFKE